MHVTPMCYIGLPQSYPMCYNISEKNQWQLNTKILNFFAKPAITRSKQGDKLFRLQWDKFKGTFKFNTSYFGLLNRDGVK